MDKKIKSWLIISLLLVFLVLVVLNSIYNKNSRDTEENEKVIRVAASASEPIFDAPFIIPYKKGFFDKQGIRVELVSLGSGGDIKQALATGQVDVGATASVNFLIASSKGAPVKVIAFKNIAPLYMYVNPESNITKIRDLEGKIIGTRPDGSGALLLNYVLKNEGVDLNSVTFLSIDKTTAPLALMDRKIIDAVPVTPGAENPFDEAGATRLMEWEEKGYSRTSSSGATVFSIIAVNSEFLNENPAAMEAFIEGYIEGHRFMKEHPDETASLLTQYASEASGGAITPSIEEIKQTLKQGDLEYLIWRDPEILVELSRIATASGITEKELSLEEIFDMRYKEMLISAQNEIYGPQP